GLLSSAATTELASSDAAATNVRVKFGTVIFVVNIPPYGFYARRLQEESLRWVVPNPVAPLLVIQIFAVRSAIILFIPSKGVEKELAVSGAPILIWIATDRVVGQLCDELRHERLELIRELPVSQVVSFQRAG